MSRNRFVTPETHRLDLSDGDWVEVKARLGTAEDQRLKSAIFRGVQTGTNQVKAGNVPSDLELRVDTSMAYMAKLFLYIQEWSFVDQKGKAVKVTRSAIENLDPDTSNEILEKLNEYLDEQEEARKDPFGKNAGTE